MFPAWRGEGASLVRIGGFVVREDARHRGIGQALLSRALEAGREAGAVDAALEATPDGARAAARGGFADDGALARWQRDAAPPTGAPPASAALYPISSCEVMDLAAYDAARFGASRASILAELVALHPELSFVAFDRATGVIAGFALATRARIGPVVADDHAIARRLVDAALLAGAPAALDAPESAWPMLEAAGWHRAGRPPWRRMVRGRRLGRPAAVIAVADGMVG